jgi:hypothetical protein
MQKTSSCLGVRQTLSLCLVVITWLSSCASLSTKQESSNTPPSIESLHSRESPDSQRNTTQAKFIAQKAYEQYRAGEPERRIWRKNKPGIQTPDLEVQLSNIVRQWVKALNAVALLKTNPESVTYSDCNHIAMSFGSFGPIMDSEVYSLEDLHSRLRATEELARDVVPDTPLDVLGLLTEGLFHCTEKFDPQWTDR